MQKRGTVLKKTFLFASASFLILFLTYFVLAALTVTRTDFTTTQFNFNEDTVVLYNVTVNNTNEGAPANVTDVNITVPSSFTYTSFNGTNAGGTNLFLNGTSASGLVMQWRNNTGTDVSRGLINGSALGTLAGGGIKNFWFNASAATPGIYNVTVEVKNATGLYNTNLTVRINDTTRPVVFVGNITVVDRVNVSGILVLNVSVFDNSIINAVLFNISNSSGEIILVNSTNSSAITGGSSVYWNSTIDTRNYADGVYNLTILANDTYGSGVLNNSAVIQLTFDNTDPTGSITCDPNPVDRGDVTTCTCSAQDALSGVNSTSTTASPSTTQTGTFDIECVATDIAGNVAIIEGEYSVEGSSSRSGTGGSSSSTTTSTVSWTRTEDKSTTNLDNVEGSGATAPSISASLGSRERARITVRSVEHHIGVVSITSASAVIEISSAPQRSTFVVGETKSFDVSDDGTNDISVTLVSIRDGKANLRVDSLTRPAEVVPVDGTNADSEVDSGMGNSGKWIMGLIIVAVIAAVIFFITRAKRR